MLKKLLVLFFCLAASGFLYGQQFQITSVDYEILPISPKSHFKTDDYQIAKEIPVNTKKVFASEEDLFKYLDDYRQKLKNLRAFEEETIEINYEYSEPVTTSTLDDQGQPLTITFVTLHIKAQDAHHLVIIPGPKYNSNSGLTLKIKLKDTNFLGTLQTLRSDFYVMIPTSESDATKFETGINFAYDYPFQLGIFDALWLNDLGISYTSGDRLPEFGISTGLRLELPFEKTKLIFEVDQKFAFDNSEKFKEYDDSLYFADLLKVSAPIVLADLEYFGKLTYTPYFNSTFYWDINGIHKDNTSLASPVITGGHSLSFGRKDWNKNLRTGLSLSLDNYYSYNFKTKIFSPVVRLDTQAYKSFDLFNNKYTLNSFGICASLDTFTYLTKPSEDPFTLQHQGIGIGGQLRGIRDSQVYEGTGMSALSPTSAIILNLDFPLHVLSTYFTKTFLKYLNFDMQLSPFVDIALCYNKITKEYFNPKDGFYAAGLEVIVYLHRWSSTAIRGSVGIDVGRKFFPGMLNMDWRDGVSKKEFSLGLELHY